jgi:hypothetical protein
MSFVVSTIMKTSLARAQGAGNPRCCGSLPCQASRFASAIRTLTTARIARASAIAWRRRSIAAPERSPCFHIPCFGPGGAPGDAPPCIRQRRRFRTAGPRQGVPRRVRAPQRGQACAKDRGRRQLDERTGLSLLSQSPPITAPPPCAAAWFWRPSPDRPRPGRRRRR